MSKPNKDFIKVLFNIIIMALLLNLGIHIFMIRSDMKGLIEQSTLLKNEINDMKNTVLNSNAINLNNLEYSWVDLSNGYIAHGLGG